MTAEPTTVAVAAMPVAPLALEVKLEPGGGKLYRTLHESHDVLLLGVHTRVCTNRLHDGIENVTVERQVRSPTRMRIFRS